jgi:hypothetical protein
VCEGGVNNDVTNGEAMYETEQTGWIFAFDV